jgi:hypothetical protein
MKRSAARVPPCARCRVPGKPGHRNVSALHWDMICDMRQGEAYADGRLIYKDGKFSDLSMTMHDVLVVGAPVRPAWQSLLRSAPQDCAWRGLRAAPPTKPWQNTYGVWLDELPTPELRDTLGQSLVGCCGGRLTSAPLPLIVRMGCSTTRACSSTSSINASATVSRGLPGLRRASSIRRRIPW